jgi:hypothetical protein
MVPRSVSLDPAFVQPRQVDFIVFEDHAGLSGVVGRLCEHALPYRRRPVPGSGGMVAAEAAAGFDPDDRIGKPAERQCRIERRQLRQQIR